MRLFLMLILVVLLLPTAAHFALFNLDPVVLTLGGTQFAPSLASVVFACLVIGALLCVLAVNFLVVLPMREQLNQTEQELARKRDEISGFEQWLEHHHDPS